MNKTKSKQQQQKQYLSIDQQIQMLKFLAESHERSYNEVIQSQSVYDSIIEELEQTLKQEEEQSRMIQQMIQEGKASIREINQNRQENMLWDHLKSQMQILENKTNSLISSKHQLESSYSILEQMRNKRDIQIEKYKETLSYLQKKKIHLERAKREIIEEDRQINRLMKQYTQLEMQNQQIFVLKRKLNNTLQEIKGNIRVYCRIRPPKAENSIIDVTSSNTLVIKYERDRNRKDKEQYTQGYVFQQIFDPNCGQELIFLELRQLVKNAVEGKNVCIFAYGQTGSGKTFTLLGPHNENMMYEEAHYERGVAQRSMELIFSEIQDRKKFRWNMKAFLSIQEIYLQSIIDLVQPGETSVKEKDKVIEIEVRQVEQVLTYIKVAMLNRKKAATNMNERSSRSHLIITLRLEGYQERSDDRMFGSLVLVDLAGSQRLKTSKVQGHELKETQFINKSLSSLGTVINQMRKGSEHISFRNSKLTHVLQRYLEGESKTLMFVNLSPDPEDVNQTKISLTFAQGVRQAKMKK